MRHRPIPLIASLENYDRGPAVGTPTKIEIPTAYVNNGPIPGEGWAAQWESWWKHYIQKQLEYMSRWPWLNLTELAYGATETVLPLGAPTRAARSANGITWVAVPTEKFLAIFGNVNRESPITGIGITPSSGTFTGEQVVYSPQLDVVVYGGTHFGSDKLVWTVNPSTLTATEITLPSIPATRSLVAVDRSTGYIYAIVDDSKRSVCRSTDGSSFTKIGELGSSVSTPTASDRLLAVDGTVLLLRPGASAGAVTLYYLHPPYTGSAQSQSMGVSAIVLDFQYSAERGTYRAVLSNGTVLEFSEPGGSVTTHATYFGNISGAVVTDWMTFAITSGHLRWSQDFGASYEQIDFLPVPSNWTNPQSRIFSDGGRLYIIQSDPSAGESRIIVSMRAQ